MAQKQNVKVSVQVDRHKEGNYWAWAQVQATGQATWQGGAFGKTPQQAFDAISGRIAVDLKPGKRGRKPRGYQSIMRLKYGWE